MSGTNSPRGHTCHPGALIDHLALRPGETFEIYELDDIAKPDFLVALCPTPSLPFRRADDCSSLALLCLARFGEVWGWCPLAPNTKNQLGRALERADADIDRWLALVIERGRDRSISRRVMDDPDN